jgi:hypothetical protein
VTTPSAAPPAAPTPFWGPAIAAVLLALVGLAAYGAVRRVPAEPAPAPVEQGTSELPPLYGATPDDPPALTHSGRVFPSGDPDRPPAYGPTAAKVNIIVYSDFTCPVCRRGAAATRQIVEEWPGAVRLEFRTFAPAKHGNALDAAVAGLAAHRQGRFWEMHDLMFANQGGTPPALAAAAGLDMERFARDTADPALRRRILDETAEGSRLGADGTPFFLINGQAGVGWASWQAFRAKVETELKALDVLLAEGVSLEEAHRRRARANAKDEAAFEAYRSVVLEPPA